MKKIWEMWFLDERPSVSLSLFRIAAAMTVGLHVLPSFLQMGDNYLATAFRQYNTSFFPIPILEWVDKSPDWLVWTMAGVFVAGWLGFLTGLFTQASCIVTILASYFFYARNSIHIGTLSWDILLVTLFLCAVTPYLGDSFSLDSVLRAEPAPFRRKRPIFLQRLLQLQLASTFFYTGLCKWTGEGNWLSDNPYYYLMHCPPSGVMKQFWGRAFLAARPDLCYKLGMAVIAFEMSLPLWLFWRRTRPYAIALGIAFHFMLLATMHVPTIFFFLFPPLFLLFIAPETIVAWIDTRRALWGIRGRDTMVYDGECGFCRASMRVLTALDYTGRVELFDFRTEDAARLHPGLTREACEARTHLVESRQRLSGGFDAFRRLTLKLPLLWPLAPLMNLPGLRLIGEPAYAWVSRNRLRLMHASCGPDSTCRR